MPRRVSPLLALLLWGSVLACEKRGGGSAPDAGAQSVVVAPAPPDPDPVTIVVAHGEEHGALVEALGARFHESAPRLAAGAPVRLRLHRGPEPEAISEVRAGDFTPHVFCPGLGVYLSGMDRAWAARSGEKKSIVASITPLARSPLVLALPRADAEALGWPDRTVSVADLARAARAPAKGKPFTLAFAHPEHAPSGLLVLAALGSGVEPGGGPASGGAPLHRLGLVSLALRQHGASSSEALEAIIAARVTAALVPEHVVVAHNTAKTVPPLVAIYPSDGTVLGDASCALLDGPWTSDEEREAAQAFLVFLGARPQQALAREHGMRPADRSLPLGPPIDPVHGVDAAEPQATRELPAAEELGALAGRFLATKPSSDITLVLDGAALGEGALRWVQQAAEALVTVLPDREQVALRVVGEAPTVLAPEPLGKSRERLLPRIEALTSPPTTPPDPRAPPATTLAASPLVREIEAALAASELRARRSATGIHAVVVLTGELDGPGDGALRTFAGRLDRERRRVLLVVLGRAEVPRGSLVALGVAGQIVRVASEQGDYVDAARGLSPLF